MITKNYKIHKQNSKLVGLGTGKSNDFSLVYNTEFCQQYQHHTNILLLTASEIPEGMQLSGGLDFLNL